MPPKSIFQSKLTWFNIASAALMILQDVANAHVLTPDVQLYVTAAINILLRFMTTQPVSLTGK